METWRRALDEAVASRGPCRVLRVGGDGWSGTLCGTVAQGTRGLGLDLAAALPGVVIDLPGHTLHDGEAVRLWLDAPDPEPGVAAPSVAAPVRLEGSVLRLAVPVPSRSADGVLVGFLVQGDVAMAASPSGPAVLQIRLPGGGRLSLLEAPVRLVDLSVSRLAFEVPRRWPVVFPERGALRFRMGPDRDRTCEVRGRIAGVIRGRSHALYTVDFELVERRDLHAATISAIRGAP